MTEQGQRTDRVTAAVAQLGDTSPAIQLGGVHALAGLADDAPTREFRQTCIDVLCAYLRLPYDPDPGDLQEVPESPEQAEARKTYRALREVRHTVIRIIGSHPREDAAVSWKGHGFDFTDTVFDGGDSSHAHFTGGTVRFRGARFTAGMVSFADARFEGSEVNFTNARFEGGGVDFADAHFEGCKVYFAHTHFVGSKVKFRHTRFVGSKVYFWYARFESGKIYFKETRFVGGRVDFTDASFDGSVVYFDDARGRRPDGLPDEVALSAYWE
ncbi:pentapeptide repeat-containing protein [Spirillospora sp. CA-255316]